MYLEQFKIESMLLKHCLLAGGVANCLLHGVFLCTKKHLGNNLLSIIRSSGVSALEGLCMYGSYRENNRDPEIILRCPL